LRVGETASNNQTSPKKWVLTSGLGPGGDRVRKDRKPPELKKSYSTQGGPRVTKETLQMGQPELSYACKLWGQANRAGVGGDGCRKGQNGREGKGWWLLISKHARTPGNTKQRRRGIVEKHKPNPKKPGEVCDLAAHDGPPAANFSRNVQRGADRVRPKQKEGGSPQKTALENAQAGGVHRWDGTHPRR